MHRTAHPRAVALAAVLAAVFGTVLVSGGRACAQDEPAAPPAPAPQEPAKPEDAKSPPEAAEKVAERMADLYGRVAGDCPMPNPAEPDRAKLAEQVKAMDAWREGVGSLAAAADVYVARLGDAAPSARALFWGGYGKAQHADISPTAEAKAARTAAIKLLQQALAGLPADSGIRPDASYWLGRTQLFVVPSGGASADDAIANLRAAAEGFEKAERREAAGAAVIVALKHLNASGRDDQARAFVQAVAADTYDFGSKTALVRKLQSRASTGVGTKLPDLPDALDADGKAIVWKELRGAPLVIHFFSAGLPTGHGSGQRDVETTLRPLYDRLHPKGLRMVGVSMDLELAKERVAQIRANWDEWGTKERLHDGSKATVRQFAEEQGVAWPWAWDGKWLNNPVSAALGGVGGNAPHAVLVDAEGVIRWRGDAPFQGLAEAADKLITK